MAHANAPESELRDIRELVFDRAGEQGGVFRRTDLAAWNIDPSLPRLFARRRWWIRLKHGVYCDAGIYEASLTDDRLRHQLHCALAISCFDSPTYAFGVSAAVLHDLAVPVAALTWPAEVNRQPLSETRDRSKSLPGLPEGMRVHAYALNDEEFPKIHGVRVLTRSLAALSLAARLEPPWALSVMDSASWQQPGVQRELQLHLESWTSMKGYGTLKDVVPIVRSGAQSPLESISRYQLIRRGLAEPELQREFRDRRGLIGFTDMYWPQLGVVGEADGLTKYNERDDLVAEKLREDRLRALGLQVVRWTWEEIWNQPELVAHRIREAGRSAGRAVS